MANKIYDEEINKHTDWGGDSSTGNLPVSGARVQEFITRKEIFDQYGRKLGYYDGRYTFDRYGRKVGEGDLLSSLLPRF